MFELTKVFNSFLIVIKKMERFRGRDRFIFFLGGILSPYIFGFLILISKIFSVNLLILFPTFIQNLLSITLTITLLYFFIRIGKSQIRNYINQGGELSKRTIYLLAFGWWIISIFISFILLYFFMVLLMGAVFGGFAN